MNINRIMPSHILMASIIVTLSLSCTTWAKEYNFIYGNTGQQYTVNTGRLNMVGLLKIAVANQNAIPSEDIKIKYQGTELKNTERFGDREDAFNVIIPSKYDNKLKWFPRGDHIGMLGKVKTKK